jgi:tRNA A-37 threonylcarbamoyl transferase component Bud32
MPTSSSPSEREQRLERVLADYLHAVEAGTPLDRDELLKQHADLAGDLRSFFRNRDALERIAEPLKAQLPDAETIGASDSATAGAGTTIRYFGDYEVLEEIARGGMGVVYRARQVSLNRIVAVKMILAGQLASEADVRRFQAEAEAAANLDHPNIVPIYEVGEHEGQHYFSMKLVEGGSLAKEVAGHQQAALTKQRQRWAAELMVKVARAVHHAHQRGILHRDLKPANVLLDTTGEPHVTDFGLARRVDGTSGLTQSGAIVGTPAYMAPEQVRAQRQLTTGVDVYSLGAVLYELLSGKPPFQANTPFDILMQVLDNDPALPRSLRPEVDRDLETISLKCMHKAAESRYESAAALAEDLERWLAGEAIRARPTSRWERATKWVRRNKGLSVGLAAALVALVVGTAVSVWQAIAARVAAGVAEEQRDRAELLVYVGKLALAQREVEDNNADVALELLDQCAPNLRGWEHRHLLARYGGKLTLLGHEDDVQSVCYRPDGKRLASASWDKTLRAFGKNGGLA